MKFLASKETCGTPKLKKRLLLLDYYVISCNIILYSSLEIYKMKLTNTLIFLVLTIIVICWILSWKLQDRHQESRLICNCWTSRFSTEAAKEWMTIVYILLKPFFLHLHISIALQSPCSLAPWPIMYHLGNKQMEPM